MGTPSSIFDVSDRVIMVTGGSSGLGLQAVKTLVQCGARVASVARMHDAGVNNAVTDLATNRNRPVFIHSDITSPAEVARSFDECEAEFGVATVLLNNAGISQKQRAREIDRASWGELMAVNVDAQFFMAQEAARRVAAAGLCGSIINVTSILAAHPLRGTAAYSVSKAAVTQMTKALAVEWAAQGIRVNAIAPGWFPTRMSHEFLSGPGGDFIRGQNPMRRLGAEGDLDGTLLLLASDASRYMTGTVLTVDGGQSLVC